MCLEILINIYYMKMQDKVQYFKDRCGLVQDRKETFYRGKYGPVVLLGVRISGNSVLGTCKE